MDLPADTRSWRFWPELGWLPLGIDAEGHPLIQLPAF
jgi:hypothetical protein